MEYQPGVCNIGPAQQRRRLFLGIASLVATVAVIGAIILAAWPRWTLVLTVFPLYGAAMGFLQYQLRFCVGFAGLGVFDIGEGTTDVTDPQALAADRRQAVKLNVIALGVGVVGALAVYGLAARVA